MHRVTPAVAAAGAEEARAGPPASGAGRSLGRPVLLFLLALVVWLQYLNLLQSKEGPRHRGTESAFTLHGGEAGGGGGEGRRRSLLTPISEYLERVAAEKAGGVDGLAYFDGRDHLSAVYAVVDADADEHQNASTSSSLPSCPLIPPDLHGPVKVVTPGSRGLPADMDGLERRLSELLPHLEEGGAQRPANCSARHKVAVIVPYRDREEHLRTFLANIHPFLAKQQLDYRVYVVEQTAGDRFNRAMLMNVGAAEALKHRPDTACFIFHDVDLLPEDDRNLYTCPAQPRHMSVAINSFLYHLPYDDIFGGVSGMTVEHFLRVNGFSNSFWGWGGEDDDMSNRLRHKRLYISRYPANIARYKMLKHSKGKANPDRFKMLYSGSKRMASDGYRTLRYSRVKVQYRRLFTWILVELPHIKVKT